jgi:hypothetical protein
MNIQNYPTGSLIYINTFFYKLVAMYVKYDFGSPNPNESTRLHMIYVVPIHIMQRPGSLNDFYAVGVKTKTALLGSEVSLLVKNEQN